MCFMAGGHFDGFNRTAWISMPGAAATWRSCNPAGMVMWPMIRGLKTLSGTSQRGMPAPPAATVAPVILKLHWCPQAQFAGYLLAQDKGFFRAAGLGDVDIRWSTAGEHSLDTLIEREFAFCTGWLCDALVRRANGVPLPAPIGRPGPPAFAHQWSRSRASC